MAQFLSKGAIEDTEMIQKIEDTQQKYFSLPSEDRAKMTEQDKHMFYATNYAEGFSTPEVMLPRVQDLLTRIKQGDLVLDIRMIMKQLMDADPNMKAIQDRIQSVSIQINQINDKKIVIQNRINELKSKLVTLSGGRRRRSSRRATKRRARKASRRSRR